MTENKLQHLKDLPTPPPRDAARERALAAAMAAFDAAPATEAKPAARAPSPLVGEGWGGGDAAAVSNDPTVGLPPTPGPSPRVGGEITAEKISTTTPKDADGSGGPTLTNIPVVRRRPMHPTRFHYGLAASVAALVVAAPIGMQMMRQNERIFHKVPPTTMTLPADQPNAPVVQAPATPATVAPARRTNELAKTEAKPAEPQPNVAGKAKPDADKQTASRGLLPDAQHRIAELDAATARKGDRKTEATVATPQGTLKMDSGRAQEPVASASPSVTVAAAPPPVALAPAKPSSADHVEMSRSDKSQVPMKEIWVGQVSGGQAPGAAPTAPPVALAPAKPTLAAPQADAASRFRFNGDVMIADGSAQPLGGVAPYVSVKPVAPGEIRAAMQHQPRIEPAPMQVEENRDQFQTTADNPVKQVAAEPVSTFSIDVDTASYSFARRALNSGRLPQKDAVRVEEMINYFPYDYTRPETAEVPFQPNVSVFPAPWNSAHKLVHIGLKGYELKSAERPRANIVLLIDTSGSMSPEDRLPLLKNAFRMLVDELKPDDTVSIVTYAGDTRVALNPTQVSDKGRILAAIDSLRAGGGTYGEGGVKKAYELAEASFQRHGVNRIVLGTDGDFNIGISNRDELKGYIERKRDKGIFLSIVGVGHGNYNDALMQALAQNGNGTAAYVDTLNEARKVLVDEASSTLFPIAKDVKIQVEFNPAVVSEYRLIGYETRMLKREDFNNDKVDAGDVGSGHTVTAIYEVTPVGAQPAVDALRYGAAAANKAEGDGKRADASGEIGFLKLRYKLPKEDASKLLTLAIGPQQTKASITEAPTEARFATAVAAFGQLLRGSPYLGSFGYDDVASLAQGARGEDRFGYRAEFLNLVRLAKSARK